MISLLTRQHRFENHDIKSRSQFFESDFAFLQSLFRQNAEGFEPLQNAKQGIDVLIPEIKLRVDVGSHCSSRSVPLLCSNMYSGMHSATSDRSSRLTRLHRAAIPGGINVEQEPLGYGHRKASCRCNGRFGPP
jgi:hypothetical protein